MAVEMFLSFVVIVTFMTWESSLYHVIVIRILLIVTSSLKSAYSHSVSLPYKGPNFTVVYGDDDSNISVNSNNNINNNLPIFVI
jgi:hypothetical protein